VIFYVEALLKLNILKADDIWSCFINSNS